MIPLSIFSSAIVALSTPLTAAAINIDASNVNIVLLRTLSFESHVIFFHSFFTPPKNDLLFVIFLPGSEPVLLSLKLILLKFSLFLILVCVFHPQPSRTFYQFIIRVMYVFADHSVYDQQGPYDDTATD